jgi:hypothetical protein
MVSWLIVLCLLVIALCPATLPRAGMAAVSVGAARSAIGVVAYPPAPTVCAESDERREDTGSPEDPDHRDYGQVVGCAGRSRLRLAGPAVRHHFGHLTVAHIAPN